jgi:hypothetical protein
MEGYQACSGPIYGLLLASGSSLPHYLKWPRWHQLLVDNTIGFPSSRRRGTKSFSVTLQV